MKHNIGVSLMVAALMSATAAVPTMVHAALPAQALVEGVLSSTGGVPAADGDYDFAFAIYAAAVGGEAVWKEGPVTVKIAGGRFVSALGATKALDGVALAGLAEQWLAIQIGAEPELPRQRMRSAPMAIIAGHALALSCTGCVGADQLANGGIAAAKVGFNYAGAATKGGPAADLDCTGCVTVAELKFDGDVDLGGNSLKAKNGTFSGDLAAKTVTAAGFVGDGSKLTGIVMPAGSCKAGESVKGIKADGTLECASFAGSLPGDSIAASSNGVISNVFKDAFSAPTKDIAIPDNTGSSATSEIVVPDLGLARDLTIQVKVANSDLAGLSIKLLPPDDKAKGWTLCDPCGKTDEKTLDSTWSVKAPPPVGDIQKWIGGNPKGAWTLKVLDTSFCVPQKPGNAALCDLGKQLDGKIVDWSMAIETLSNNKVADPKGHLYARVVSAAAADLADGKSIEVDTLVGSPALVAQAWVEDAANKRWVQAATGVDAVGQCASCGSGKDGDYNATSNKSLSTGTYEFKSFTIDKGVTVTGTGSGPIIIKVQGKVQIDGVLTLNGAQGEDIASCCNNSSGGAAGPGGGAGGGNVYGNGGSNGSGSGGGGGGCAAGYGSGGGGGGYGANGNGGKTSGNSCSPGGSAGSSYGNALLGTFTGGSGGGSGGFGGAANSSGAGGGGGGGALRIDASEIAVASGGSITANGGRGGNIGGDRDGGAGGGGSGGALWLRAGKIILTGAVTALGGAAGVTDQVNGYGGDGGAGSVGRVRVDGQSIVGTSNPPHTVGDATDLGTLLNKFGLEQVAPGKVRLTNGSGKPQSVRLVVTY